MRDDDDRAAWARFTTRLKKKAEENRPLTPPRFTPSPPPPPPPPPTSKLSASSFFGPNFMRELVESREIAARKEKEAMRAEIEAEFAARPPVEGLIAVTDEVPVETDDDRCSICKWGIEVRDGYWVHLYGQSWPHVASPVLMFLDRSVVYHRMRLRNGLWELLRKALEDE